MKFINKYLRNFTPYQVASHKIWTVSAESRKEILKLDWNEATIPPSPKVAERIINLVKQDNFYNLYPSTYNIKIMELLSEYLLLPEDNLQYFASSDSLHEYIAKLYITVGDPILLLGPTYDNFRLTADVCGAKIYFFYMNEQFVFDRDAFKKKIEEIEPSLVYICNPNNPTGVLHSVEYIEELLCEYPQVLFLIDEAYAEFTEISAKELVLKYENILISRTFSKAFALANFRFGYLMASKSNIEYISSIRNPKNITTFAQEAAIGALEDIDYMKNYVNEVKEAGRLFRDKLNRFTGFLECVPGEGNFVLIKFAFSEDKKEMIDYLEKRKVYVRDLSQTEFLKKYCLRITIGTQKQMIYVASMMEEMLREKYGI